MATISGSRTSTPKRLPLNSYAEIHLSKLARQAAATEASGSKSHLPNKVPSPEITGSKFQPGKVPSQEIAGSKFQPVKVPSAEVPGSKPQFGKVSSAEVLGSKPSAEVPGSKLQFGKASSAEVLSSKTKAEVLSSKPQFGKASSAEVVGSKPKVPSVEVPSSKPQIASAEVPGSKPQFGKASSAEVLSSKSKVPGAEVPGSKSHPGMTTVPKSQPQIVRKGSLGSLVSATSKPDQQGPVIRRTSVEGSIHYSTPSTVARHHSVPEEISHTTAAGDDRSLSVVVSGPSDEHVLGRTSADMQQPPVNSMSLTWPRANLATHTAAGSTATTTVPPLNLKGSMQINADPMGVAGGKAMYDFFLDLTIDFFLVLRSSKCSED